MKKIETKNFGLHESDFHEMCAQLKKGDETIFERIYLAHFKPCKSYLKSSLRADENESHDATMQTLLNFRRSLILDKIQYGNLNFLFTQMAYYEVLKVRSKNTLNQDRNLEYYRSASIDLKDDEIESHEDLIKILETLNSKQMELITNHYYNNMKLSDMAAAEGVPSSTIRKRKERVIMTIKTNFLDRITNRNERATHKYLEKSIADAAVDLENRRLAEKYQKKLSAIEVDSRNKSQRLVVLVLGVAIFLLCSFFVYKMCFYQKILRRVQFII